MHGKRILVATLAILFLAHLAYYHSSLPERVASHFNAAGEPNGWMSKNAFFAFEIVLYGLVVGLILLVPLGLRRLPVRFINLPNRDYWLAPERRAQTVQTLADKTGMFLLALLPLLIAMNQLVFRANVRRENLSPASWIVLAAFVLFTVTWTFKLVRQFGGSRRTAE